jgi:hypothetical protein
VSIRRAILIDTHNSRFEPIGTFLHSTKKKDSNISVANTLHGVSQMISAGSSLSGDSGTIIELSARKKKINN